MSFDKNKEILLIPNKNRFVLFPIQYPEIWAYRELALSSFWTANEIDFTIDQSDFTNVLTDNERYFLKNILAFFAFSDGIVNENLAMNFYNEVQIPEARSLYASQIQIEDIHSQTYSLMIDTFIKDPKDKANLFNALETNPIVTKKAEWAMKWLNGDKPFNERILAFGVVEGVFFSASFAVIFWFKTRNLMPGLGMANQFISRDEALHCRTAVLLYNLLDQKLSQEVVHSIFKEAYSIEEEFITKSLPVSLIGMNSEMMCDYIKFVCDYWLVEFGYTKLYFTKNPFPFMDYIGLEIKSNFFEKRESNYSKANIGATKEELMFSLDEDF